jgi:hypothetical protein
MAFVLTHNDPTHGQPGARDAMQALRQTEKFWRDWSSRYKESHAWHDEVLRSLLTLKALTDDRTGGMVGAPTLGLPEVPGGVKNYDYRHTWLRDATFIRASRRTPCGSTGSRGEVHETRRGTGTSCDVAECAAAGAKKPRQPWPWPSLD